MQLVKILAVEASYLHIYEEEIDFFVASNSLGHIMTEWKPKSGKKFSSQPSTAPHMYDARVKEGIGQ